MKKKSMFALPLASIIVASSFAVTTPILASHSPTHTTTLTAEEVQKGRSVAATESMLYRNQSVVDMAETASEITNPDATEKPTDEVPTKTTPLTLNVWNYITYLWKLPTTQGIEIDANVPSLDASNTVQLEEYDTASHTWDVISSQSTGNNGSTQNLTFIGPRENFASGNATYRLHSIAGNSAYKDAYSSQYSVSYNRTPTKVVKSPLVNGKTYTYGAGTTTKLYGSLDNTNTVRVVQLQQYAPSTKTWIVQSSSKTSIYGGYTITLPATSALGSSLWRVYFPITSDYSATSSGSSTIKRVASKASVTVIGGLDKQVPWQSNTITWSVVAPVSTSVQVERYQNKKWVAVSNTSVNKKFHVAYSVPRGTTSSSNGWRLYRLHVKPVSAGWTSNYSSAFKNTVENPNRYTGMAKTVYNYMKPYCSVQFINIKSKISGNSDIWGLNHLGTQDIDIYSKVPAKYLQTVSLHECGHSRQWALYSSNWSGFKTQMNKVYGQTGSVGMEQDADCIANTWHKNSYFGYKGNCNGSKGKAAATIASGRKY